MEMIIDYALGNGAISNPDGTSSALADGCSPAKGPGPSPLGDFPRALDFAPRGQVQASLPRDLALPKFCVRLVLELGAVERPQTLFSCAALPLRISLDRDPDSQYVLLSARLQNTGRDAVTVTTRLAVGEWTTLDIAYDTDTLALFVNELAPTVAALTSVQLGNSSDHRLTLGGATGGANEAFSGKIAAFQLMEGIPAHLEDALDARRSSPEWHISLKHAQLRPKVDLGAPLGRPRVDAKSGVASQRHEKGVIFFDPADGQSAAMHGVIYELWSAQPTLQAELGALLRDEMDGGKPGTRKSVFENGAIFWSAATGAVPMLGRKMLADYIKLGEAANPGGLPNSAASAVPGGMCQELQNGILYFSTAGITAFVLHGAFAAKYRAAGGHAQYGLPTSDVVGISPVQTRGKVTGHMVQLEKNAAIFAKAGGEACLLEGAILKAYLAAGGPSGALGWPASEVGSFSGGIKHGAFEHGAIAQVGTKAPVVIRPFTLFVGRVETEESEGFGRGENDLYMYFRVKSSGHEVYEERYPASGDIGGRNIAEPNFRTQTFDPSDPRLKLSLELDVWEVDAADADDHLGVFRRELTIENLWGLREEPLGIFESGKVEQIAKVHWAVQQEVTEATPFDFWNTGNRGTATITEAQFAAAFSDVDTETEWYDIPDWLRKGFYELAVKGLAAKGNCFGMSTEAIYAWKGLSVFGRPLARFDNFEDIRHEVNIKHCYQLGAEPILWFLEQLVSGNTHNPKNVFKETRDTFKAGLNPVLCLTSDWRFSDAHCLLPFAWDSSSTPWKITVFDPNRRNTVQTVLIDPDANTFGYLNTYRGGTAIDSGHLHYMPWSVLCRAPTTPVGALLDLGVSLIIGSATGTSRITGASGANLFANRDANELASGLREKFISLPGWAGSGTLAGEVLIRPVKPGAKLELNFTHELEGLKSGALDYSVRYKRQAFQLQSSIEKSELTQVGMLQLGSAQQQVSLQAPKDKLIRLRTEHRMGDGRDVIRVDISRIPLATGREARISIQPGGGAVDIVAGPDAVDARVDVSGTLSGHAFSQAYDARLEGGTRLILAHAHSSNLVKIGRIDQVFGGMRDPQLVRKR